MKIRSRPARRRGHSIKTGARLRYVPNAHSALLEAIAAFAATSPEARARRGDPTAPPAAILGYNVRNGSELRFGLDSDVFRVDQETIYGAPSKPGRNPTSKGISYLRYR